MPRSGNPLTIILLKNGFSHHNFNDLEMIEYAGIGVAMQNSPEGLQPLADWVAPSVEDDGAAVAIEKFVLSN